MAYHLQQRENPTEGKSPLSQKRNPSANSSRLAASKSSVHMYSLKDFDNFYEVRSPILSREKKLMIEEKLQLDYEVRREIENRNRENNLFVKFMDNPFSKDNINRLVSPFEKFEQQLLKKRRRGKGLNDRQYLQQPKSNIIEAVSQLKQNHFHRNAILSNERRELLDRSQKLVKSSMKKNPRQLLPEGPQIDSKTEKVLSLDQILQIDDQNYYSVNQVEINIFQFLKRGHRPFLSMDVLDKYHFHFTSMTEKMEKVKFPVLRDLSQLGRKLAKGRLIDSNTIIGLILSSEAVVRPADLRFQDLMGVASGRFTTQLAYSAVNQEIMRMEFTAEVSEIQMQEIHYAEETFNRQQNFVGRGEARQEIENYKLLQNDDGEQKFQNYCRKVQKGVKEELETKKALIKNTIKDEKLYNQIDGRVQENILYLANMAKTEGGAAADRLIRFNKSNKNRKEAILIRNLLNSITLRNREEEKIQELLRGKKVTNSSNRLQN